MKVISGRQNLEIEFGGVRKFWVKRDFFFPRFLGAGNLWDLRRGWGEGEVWGLWGQRKEKPVRCAESQSSAGHDHSSMPVATRREQTEWGAAKGHSDGEVLEAFRKLPGGRRVHGKGVTDKMEDLK